MKPNKKWVPKAGEKWWYILIDATTIRFRYTCFGVPRNAFAFRTKREAQEAARKIDSILRGKP